MRYCTKCIQPDTRPGIVFDEEQVCSACRWAEYRATEVDWAQRKKELLEIANSVKRTDGRPDCIIGVSGGKDSHFQAFYVRTLGLRPLLVNCVPENLTDVGRTNLDNLVRHGFDLISIRPNPNIARELTKQAFFKYCNPVKPSEYSLFASSWIVAAGLDILLVIQGENPVHTLGIVEDMDSGDNAYNIRQHNTTSGDAQQWLYEGIDLSDLFFYQFPSPPDLPGVRSIWLSYYTKEWSYYGNTKFAILKGLRGRSNHSPLETGKLSSYCSTDSDIHILNQFLKYLKFGFGFVTDEVSYLIREGHLDRTTGISLVKNYDGKLNEKYIHDFCSYIRISISDFWKVVDRFVNKDLFHKDAAKAIWRTGNWAPKFTVGEDYVPR